MENFEINGAEYRADKLTAMQQFHVSRRIAPLIPALIPIAMSVMKSLDKDGDMVASLLSNPAVLQPFTDALAALPDEQINYVFDECLGVVKRKVGDGWMRVWDKKSHTTLSDDVGDMSVLLPVVVQIIKDNLGPFIRGFLTSQAPAPEPKA